MTPEEMQEEITQLVAALAYEFGADAVADWLIDLADKVEELELEMETIQ